MSDDSFRYFCKVIDAIVATLRDLSGSGRTTGLAFAHPNITAAALANVMAAAMAADPRLDEEDIKALAGVIAESIVEQAVVIRAANGGRPLGALIAEAIQ
jgi:hypothetical protein